MMQDDIIALLTAVLGRAPAWIRRDLSSKDVGVRVRAEEALAALIGNALEGFSRGSES